MEEWLNIVIRQLILYSLPVLISLFIVTLIESKFTRSNIPHPFYNLSWHGVWLPLLASLAFHRGLIIALPRPLQSGPQAAAIRCLAHLLLCAIGFLLYTCSLQYPAATGLPPLHHWWAKVLMFFNLCLFCLHLLPLPGQWLGEYITTSHPHLISPRIWRYMQHIYVYPLIAASPLLDWLLGGWIIFPIYEQLSHFAATM